MKATCLLLSLLFSLTTLCQTYYIVRHAEKAQASAGGTMATTNNPPLSQEGEKRAQALKNLLKNKNIKSIYSTKTTRTLSTAEPLSKAIHVTVEVYDTVNTAFIRKLKDSRKNTLIIGHSNTIDDITNALSNDRSVSGDIPDSDYDNLFIVKSKGGKITFEAKKY